MRHIKLPVHFFEDDKFKAIRSQKEGDRVILLYMMLIAVAVKSDANGKLMLFEGIPYDDTYLSSILSLPSTTVKSGLELLVKFGLLTVSDSVFSLSNYDEYADMKTAKERRQNADRQAKFKARKNDTNITVTDKKSGKTAAAEENA